MKPHNSSELGPWFPSLQKSLSVSPVLSPATSHADDAERAIPKDLWQGEANYDVAWSDHDWADDLGYDNAVIHYEPTNDIPSLPSPAKSIPGSGQARTRRSSRSRSASPNPTPTPERKTRTRKTKPASKKAKQDEQISDEDLHAKLRERIEQDATLYNRILRYEVCIPISLKYVDSDALAHQPIHFDVFFALVADIDTASRGLKLRVREFLDDQAIHFYGLVSTSDRTRKRRR